MHAGAQPVWRGFTFRNHAAMQFRTATCDRVSVRVQNSSSRIRGLEMQLLIAWRKRVNILLITFMNLVMLLVSMYLPWAYQVRWRVSFVRNAWRCRPR